MGPGSPYDFPRIAAKTVKDVISRTILGSGRGYVLGNNLRTPGARLKVTEISVELADESAPYAYGLQYRHNIKGGPDILDLKIFYTPTRHTLLMHIAKDCRSRKVIVPEDFEVILERYVGYMEVIDDYIEGLLK